MAQGTKALSPTTAVDGKNVSAAWKSGSFVELPRAAPGLPDLKNHGDLIFTRIQLKKMLCKAITT